jgi:hypothetical protein
MQFMSNIFSNAATELQGSEKEKDVLGGRTLLPTGLYEGTLDVVYLTKSQGGATAFNLVVDIGGKKVRDTVYVTNRAGGVTYTKDGKKYPLPGYSLINALCKLTAGKEIPQLTFEKKLVKIYNFEQRKEVPTEVEVAVELVGQPVRLGIEFHRENKNVKDQAGNYVPTSDIREFNTITRVFHTQTGQTAAEYNAQAPAEFMAMWVKEFDGKVIDKTAKGPVAPAPTAGPAAPAAGGKPSLFGGG